jgi:hypothetical protein
MSFVSNNASVTILNNPGAVTAMTNMDNVSLSCAAAEYYVDGSGRLRVRPQLQGRILQEDEEGDHKLSPDAHAAKQTQTQSV